MVSEHWLVYAYKELLYPLSMENTKNLPSTSSTAPFSLTSSHSLRKSTANKLDYLYELSYISDTNKISSESLPLINPYHAFTKTPNSLVRSIKTLIKTSLKAPKEYIQASNFSQFQLPATSQVQFHDTSRAIFRREVQTLSKCMCKFFMLTSS